MNIWRMKLTGTVEVTLFKNKHFFPGVWLKKNMYITFKNEIGTFKPTHLKP